MNQKTGKREPIDAAPRENGNIEIIGERETEYGAAPLIRHMGKNEASLPGLAGDRYVSHFATCPQADQHRQHQKKGST